MNKSSQARARRVHKLLFYLFFIGALLLGPAVEVALTLSLFNLGVVKSLSIAKEIGYYSGRAFSTLVCLCVFLIARRTKVWNVSRETEIVRRTATEFPGAWIQIERANSFLAKLFAMLAFVGASTYFLIFANNPDGHAADGFLGALGIILSCAGIIWFFANIHRPKLRVDERGIFGYKFYFWPRLVVWGSIERARIERTFSARGEESYSVLLQDARGHKLLFIDSGLLNHENRRRSRQIVDDIRCRLRGHNAD